MRKTFGKEMEDYLRKINDRWIVMPSEDLFDDSEGKIVIRSKVSELKNKIIGVRGVEKDDEWIGASIFQVLILIVFIFLYLLYYFYDDIMYLFMNMLSY